MLFTTGEREGERERGGGDRVRERAQKGKEGGVI